MAICFSWIIARTKSATGKGNLARADMDLRKMQEKGNDIESEFAHFTETFMQEGYIYGKLSFFGNDINIKQSFSRFGVKRENMSEYSSLSVVSDYVNEKRQNNLLDFSLPVLVYYPTNRSVIDIPMRIRMQHSFGQFSTYENALDSNVRFRDFFEWYRDREDFENEKKTDLRNFDFKDGILECVRNAIYQFMPGYKNLHIQRAPLLMTITKDGITIPINVLSDGEKCVLSIVGDLARRLAIANPALTNPLEGYGIVLAEVDNTLSEISKMIDEEKYDDAKIKISELEGYLNGPTPDTL